MNRTNNPLWFAWHEAVGTPREGPLRERAIQQYAFAVPGDEALEAIRVASPRGVVEIGAGTGYWAWMLRESGVDVVAYDTAPAGRSENPWFATSSAWFDVTTADHGAVEAHGDRTLLLVWPTRNEDWAADATQRFAAAGGTMLVYVGEPPGGRTGDDRFHALIGELDRCWTCAYDITTAPCVCGVTPLFEPIRTVALPRWTSYDDKLGLYVRDHHATALGPEPLRAHRLHRAMARHSRRLRIKR